MTIVFVIDYYNSMTDGTIITARRFHDELVRQGHTVRIVSYGIEGENKYGLKEHHIPFVSKYSKKFNVIYAKFDKKVMREALKGADLVHLFLPFQVQRKALKLARKMNVAVSAAFHVHPQNILKNAGIKNSKLLSDFIFWYFRKTFYDKVTHIHCPSQFTADELAVHKYKSCLHVISNGVSPHFVPPENKNINIMPNDEKKFNILMVGRLAAEKRQDLLIRAVAASKYRNRINITFAGQGFMKDQLIEMSKDLPNPPSFSFLPHDKLLETIYNSDLYIHAADVEIEGISCIEAFSCGLVPVIGNAEKSATKQFVLDERCSFIAGNPDNLKDKIEYWIEHPEELEEMGKEYAIYAKNYNLEACVKKAEEMFRQTVDDDAELYSKRLIHFKTDNLKKTCDLYNTTCDN